MDKKENKRKVYKKLRNPLPRSKNEGIQKRITGIAKKIDKINIKNENMSITLIISPIKINNPLANKRPAQNKII